MKSVIRFGYLLFFFSLIILAFTYPSLAQAAELSFSPSSATIVHRVGGDSTTIAIQVSNVSNLYGANIDVIYNPSVVKVQSISEGNFLNRDGQPTHMLTHVDSVAGRANIGISRLGNVGGVSGNGTVASITFRSKAAGTSNLTFSKIKLKDPNLSQIPVSLRTGTISVVTDTIPPSFTIGLLQHPFLTRYMAVYVVPSESLSVGPTATVRFDGSTTPLSMSSIDTLTNINIYYGEHHLTANGSGMVEVSGTDYAGNSGTDSSRAFSVQFMRAIAGGSIVSPDRKVSLVVPANSLPNDIYVTITSDDSKSPSSSSLARLAPLVQATPASGPGVPIGGAYQLGPAGITLENPATLTFSYADRQLPRGANGRLGIYALQGSRWVYGGGEVNEANQTISATITEFTVYQLRFDTSETQVTSPGFRLFQNYPNPFNPTTQIRYELGTDAHVVLKVYNILGQEVRVLVDEKEQAGSHTVLWDGKDSGGRELASGVYFLRCEAGAFKATRKMVLIK